MKWRKRTKIYVTRPNEMNEKHVRANQFHQIRQNKEQNKSRSREGERKGKASSD